MDVLAELERGTKVLKFVAKTIENSNCGCDHYTILHSYIVVM